MLGAEYGGLRPWEVAEFSPNELKAIARYRRELEMRKTDLG